MPGRAIPRCLSALLAIVGACCCALQSARAATPSPSPAPESFCGARTALVTALDGEHGAQTYAVAFQAAGDSPGSLSGTLTMYAGASRYDIPFRNAKAYPAIDLATLTPLVVRFPSMVSIDAVYLSSIDGPDGGPCSLTSNTPVIATFEDAYTKRARRLPAINAPPPVRDPAPCADPYVSARVLKPGELTVEPDMSQSAGFGGEVRVLVGVGPTGAITDLTPIPPIVTPALEQAGINMARHATYAPAVVRCKHVESAYVYAIMFGGQQTHIIP
jgi:hypothetical protein